MTFKTIHECRLDLRCPRRVRKLLDAAVPNDSSIQQYGVYRIGNYSAEEMANYLIGHLGPDRYDLLERLNYIALRYSYSPPRPSVHGGGDIVDFSAMKLYYREKP